MEDQTGLTEKYLDIVPTCDNELKPFVGRIFTSIQDFVDCYKTYAHTVGFSVRSWTCKKDTQGQISYKYFVCSKEGGKSKKQLLESTVTGKELSRKRTITREGCKATVGVKRIGENKYKVVTFQESHTHELCTPSKKHFLRSNRKVGNVQKNLLSTLDRVNIGPSQAFHIIKEQVGGYANVGFTIQDARNYARDLKALIGDSDAHMFIHNFEIQKQRDPSFYYAFQLDNDAHLKHVFWSDSTARYNYSLFGDLLSFDTTYSTNKYSMIFAPFTGINNHRLSITFGAGFLADEKSDSFEWLFDKFIDCMSGNKPSLIVTDQDPAIRSAIVKCFPTTTHRFCMWHIMKKLSEKVGGHLNSDISFQSHFKSCVWHSETTVEFETTWISIIDDYGLTKNDWLAHMFDLRSMWIPAYLKETLLSGLLRTTSRSESENSFFNHFVNNKLSLVEFISRFDSAMDAQRQKILKVNHDTLYGKPKLKTGLWLERSASEIYTHSNFYQFQDELWSASVGCMIKNSKKIDEERTVFTIIDSCNPNSKDRNVLFSLSNTLCDCKMYETQGIPCRHIITTWKSQGVNELPSYCICKRWTRTPRHQAIIGGVTEISEEERRRLLLSNVWSQLFRCMEIAKEDDEALNDLLNIGTSWEKKYLSRGLTVDVLHIANQVFPLA
ncbi:Protein FAR1-RELATED SEQUENCE 5 [Platanthera zijinensis]|uniref:Protein FAR1-RELATED SEQUENCE 5 n=1 Tax=Platanthera zijinensis TaxID=2320716 RepID=A0AAP0B340_9ASPA